MDEYYDEKYIDRHTSAFIPKKENLNYKIYVEPFPIIPTNEYMRTKKTKFGYCKPLFVNKKKETSNL